VDAPDAGSYSLAGAFLIGAVLATVATLRVMKSVTNFFSGIDRQRHLPRPPSRQGDGDTDTDMN
jgi:hypothetical protein